MTQTTTTLQGTVNLITDYEARRKALIAQHENHLRDIDRVLVDAHERKSLALQGMDLGKVRLAETVIAVNGDAAKTNVRSGAIEDAIKKLAADPAALTKKFIGVKNYDGFGDQRSDHGYGMGPRHGSIVFSIGRIKRDAPLSIEEVEAAIYYLGNIKQIQAAKQQAA